MLILTHRPGETLIIETPAGEQIQVTVLQVKGNQVRIGMNAPGDTMTPKQQRKNTAPIECEVDYSHNRSPRPISQY